MVFITRRKGFIDN